MMVTRWGLSEALGTVSYGENQDEVFLGMSVSRTQNASEATVQKIDTEIRRFVEEGYNEAHAHPHREACRPRSPGQGPARIRNAERRRDHRPAQRQEAEPRVGAGADHARAPRRCRRPASRARVPIRTPAWSRSRRRNAAAVKRTAYVQDARLQAPFLFCNMLASGGSGMHCRWTAQECASRAARSAQRNWPRQCRCHS